MSDDEDVHEALATVTLDTPHTAGVGRAYPRDDDTYDSEGDALDRRRSPPRDGADDVDPRKLVRHPSISELRWYYRNHPLGRTLVEKPIRDAFKHGYDVTNDPTGRVAEFLDDYVPAAIEARIKARRDGFAVLLFNWEDTGTIQQSPRDDDVTVTGLSGFEVLTADELDDRFTDVAIEEYVDYDDSQLVTLDHGIAAVEDVGNPDHHDPVGYVYELPEELLGHTDEPSRVFIHGDRCQHFVNKGTVDGPTHEHWVGELTGHSVIEQVYQELKALYKTNWAIGQTTFRYTSPLHVIETPEARGVDEDHMAELHDQTRNINTASTVTLPPGHQMDAIGSDGELDPREYVEPLIQQIAAATEFTQSVLMGTQTGTVSGSETDVKNYFNQVERYRNTTFESQAREAVRMAFRTDQSVIPSFALGFDIEWAPLFKIETMDRLAAMNRAVNAVATGLSNYVMSVEDAQAVLEQQWAELDADVELDELSEAEMDLLDRINVSQQGTSVGPQEREVEANRAGGNENATGQGGPPGETTDPTDPTTQ